MRAVEHYKGRQLDWDREIGRLNEASSGQRRIEMGSPASASVTRVRLLNRYTGLKIRTRGSVVVMELA